MIRLLLAALFVAIVGCNAAIAPVDPTVPPAAPSDAAIAPQTMVDGFASASAILDRSSASTLTIAIADAPTTCVVNGRTWSNLPGGARAIVVRLWSSTPIVAGTYTVSYEASVRTYERRSTTCAVLLDSEATSGIVDVERVSETSITGSFDVLVDGAPIRGTFAADACDRTGPLACK